METKRVLPPAILPRLGQNTTMHLGHQDTLLATASTACVVADTERTRTFTTSKSKLKSVLLRYLSLKLI